MRFLNLVVTELKTNRNYRFEIENFSQGFAILRELEKHFNKIQFRFESQRVT